MPDPKACQYKLKTNAKFLASGLGHIGWGGRAALAIER
jgi:hypothetical protein